MAWQLLCSAHESADKAKYADYMKRQSACEKVIRRDIARTYPEHDFFKKKDGVGQESLFNVMKAYSIHDREVGYCQGTAFIVGLLLMQMPEEETFAVLVKLMQDYRMREMFKPSMAELGLCMYQLEVLVQEHIPDLYGHFQSQSIHTNLYASSWFLTLFTTSLPIQLSCRIMDCFLADGIEAIFRLALALLLLGKNQLLVQDMEGVIRVCIIIITTQGVWLSADSLKRTWAAERNITRCFLLLPSAQWTVPMAIWYLRPSANGQSP